MKTLKDNMIELVMLFIFIGLAFTPALSWQLVVVFLSLLISNNVNKYFIARNYDQELKDKLEEAIKLGKEAKSDSSKAITAMQLRK